MEKDASNAGQNRDNQQRKPLIIPESDHPIRESHLDREALKVLYRLRDAGFKGYLVGGGVRDLYLGQQPKDFDISTDARPGQLRKIFRNSRTIGRRFRLVQVFFRGNKIIEVSTLRSQSEYDLNGPEQVLPHNNTFGTLEEDAFRRDLTINSLFYEIETNTIIDYTGGVKDLNQGVVRMVGDPNRRFTRDPVRMMRAVRHAARKGFAIDRACRKAIAAHGDKLALCPPSRLRDEVLKDLRSGTSEAWVRLCMENNLWQYLFPLYTTSSRATSKDEQAREDLFRLLQALDRLHAGSESSRPIKVPEYMLVAAVLLPWAIQRFGLLQVQVRGKGYHQLNRALRTELDALIGERLNMKRMARDALAVLLVNLPTLHQAHAGGKLPQWLKRKSYYYDCSRFYSLYRDAMGEKPLNPELFACPAQQERVEDSVPVKSGRKNSSGRRGLNPAFSSSKKGVFGLKNRG